MFRIFFLLSFLFSFFRLHAQEYVILVSPEKEEILPAKSTPEKHEVFINKDNFHTTLDRILEKEAGIHFQRYGGEGSYSLIRIRGSNANQVQIYLNGIPLNFASYSEVDVSDLHVYNYEKIEIQKNGSMTGLTGSAIGGSINLVPGMTPRKNQLYFHGGSFGTIGGGVLLQKFYRENRREDNSKGGIAVSLYRESSMQDYEFLNHNGTIYFNTLDDYRDRRKNAYYYKTSGFLQGVWKEGNTKFQVLNDTFHRLHGIPGPVTRQTEKTKREHLRNTLGFFTESDFEDFFRITTRWYYTYINNNFRDPRNELAFGSSDSKAYLHNRGVHFLPDLNFPLGDRHLYRSRWLLGYEEEFFHENKYTNFGLKTQEIPEKKRYHYSGHWHHIFYLLDGFLELASGFRYEEYRNNFFLEQETKKYLTFDELRKDESKIHFLNTQHHVAIHLKKERKFRWQLFGKYAEEKRLPSFIELFGEKGSIVPNLRLRPESSHNIEGGVLGRWDMWFWDVRIFQRQVKDLIRFLPNSQFSLRAENIEKASLTGGEFALQFRYRDLFSIYGNYGYLEAKKIDEDNPYRKETYIPLTPVHTFKGGISLFPEGKLEFQWDVQYIGAFFRSESQDYFSYRHPKWYHNMRFFYRPVMDFLLYGEVRNIQDHLYEDMVGYPLPGRSYLLGMKYLF